jgi:hypothetical protein
MSLEENRSLLNDYANKHVITINFKENILLDVTVLQWKLLNVFTLGQTQTDNINQMITISKLLKI